MDKRRLGRTEQQSSVVIFGAAGIGKVAQKDADRAIQTALDHGVNHIDVAPSYGEAELRLRPWIPRIREQVFLACKTTKRQKADAAQELRRSLDRVQTGHFDLYQLHSVNDFDQLDLATGPGGAVEALVEAREEGLVVNLGITGHGMQAPALHAEALTRFDFDTVMFPLNPTLWGDADYRKDCEALMEIAREQDVGLMVIKAVAKEPWGDRERTTTTWYKPFEDQESIDRCVHFVLSQGISALASAGDVGLLPKILDAAERFRPLADGEQDGIVDAHRKLRQVFVT